MNSMFNPYQLIENFEKEFGGNLSSPTTVLPATTKYSDWDIYINLNPEKANISLLQKIDEFVKSFSDFDLVRDFATDAEYHSKAYQRTSNLKHIQYMAFLPKESFAPFVDIHIDGVGKNLMGEFYNSKKGNLSQGYLDWAILTYWRKIMRGEGDKLSEWVERSILPAFDEEDKDQIRANPKDFFKNYFKNRPEFDQASGFLSS